MSRSFWLWVVAVAITAFFGHWQRTTGPTYPISGQVTLGGERIAYVIERSHHGPGEHLVAIRNAPADLAGTLEYMPYRTLSAWTAVPMRLVEKDLTATLPHLEPGQKFWYRVRLARGGESALLPADRPAAIRYVGEVPPYILVPHIAFMFLGLLFAIRALLGLLDRPPNLKPFAFMAFAAAFIGGIVIGPFVTHYAFGPWWTGFPFGNDITDNKTLIAVLGWAVALWAVLRRRNEKAWVVFAAVLMLAVFAIPHSWTSGEPPYAQLGGTGAVPGVPAETPATPAPADSAIR